MASPPSSSRSVPHSFCFPTLSRRTTSPLRLVLPAGAVLSHKFEPLSSPASKARFDLADGDQGYFQPRYPSSLSSPLTPPSDSDPKDAPSLSSPSSPSTRSDLPESTGLPSSPTTSAIPNQEPTTSSASHSSKRKAHRSRRRARPSTSYAPLAPPIDNVFSFIAPLPPSRDAFEIQLHPPPKVKSAKTRRFSSKRARTSLAKTAPGEEPAVDS